VLNAVEFHQFRSFTFRKVR